MFKIKSLHLGNVHAFILVLERTKRIKHENKKIKTKRKKKIVVKNNKKEKIMKKPTENQGSRVGSRWKMVPCR